MHILKLPENGEYQNWPQGGGGIWGITVYKIWYLDPGWKPNGFIESVPENLQNRYSVVVQAKTNADFSHFIKIRHQITSFMTS